MQGIRDMLTQRQSQYAWEAYLKHRKDNLTSSVGTPAALRRDPLKAKEQPSAGEKSKPNLSLATLGGTLGSRS
jgi:hypothetical protein